MSINDENLENLDLQKIEKWADTLFEKKKELADIRYEKPQKLKMKWLNDQRNEILKIDQKIEVIFLIPD